MFLGKRMRLIATLLLIGIGCQITLAGGNLDSVYHTTNGERTTIILRGAASVPYVIHQVDEQTILVDLPGATTNGIRPQYRVDSPTVDSIEMEQVHTVSGESLARMRVHLNSHCDVIPVVRDGMLTFTFSPSKASAVVPVSRVTGGNVATVITAVGAVSLTEGVVGFIDSDGPMQYKHFATPDGKRIVVDVTGVQDVTTRKAVSVDTSIVKMVRVGQFSSVVPLVTRVVFEVGQANGYTFQQDGNRLLVKFAPVPQPSSQMVASAVAAPALPIAEVATRPTQYQQQTPAQTPVQTSQPPTQTDDKKCAKTESEDRRPNSVRRKDSDASDRNATNVGSTFDASWHGTDWRNFAR